jgi:hypothetical protein
MSICITVSFQLHAWLDSTTRKGTPVTTWAWRSGLELVTKVQVYRAGLELQCYCTPNQTLQSLQIRQITVSAGRTGQWSTQLHRQAHSKEVVARGLVWCCRGTARNLGERCVLMDSLLPSCTTGTLAP